MNLRNSSSTKRALYGGHYEAGFAVCDYVSYYLQIRKSAAAVGASQHAGYVDSITDLVYQNNIECGLAAPH